MCVRADVLTCGMLKRVVLLAFVLLLGAATVAAAERTWTRSEILAIADAEAKRLGFNPESFTVSFNLDNSRWHEYVQGIQNSPGVPRILQRLKNRAYWAVYYEPMTKWESLWVFVDRETGEVLEIASTAGAFIRSLREHGTED